MFFKQMGWPACSCWLFVPHDMVLAATAEDSQSIKTKPNESTSKDMCATSGSWMCQTDGVAGQKFPSSSRKELR